MKRYIAPHIHTVYFQPEGHLAASGGTTLPIDPDPDGVGTDYSRRKRGWSCEQWTDYGAEE